jgi:hypothetical protein
MPCSPLKVNWRFGGTYLLHFRGRRISQTRNKRESRWQAGFFLGLFFHTEDGSDMFHRNVCWLSMDYTELRPRRHNSSLLKLFITHAESILHRNTHSTHGKLHLWSYIFIMDRYGYKSEFSNNVWWKSVISSIKKICEKVYGTYVRTQLCPYVKQALLQINRA